jgi:hypothetical protein
MMLYKTDLEEPGCAGCGCLIFLFIFNFLIGGWSVHTILSWFGHNIPFIFDTIIGLFVAELAFPIAVIGYILKLFGIF